MFYSETLLAKTGPLARVWLSANVERKLSKSHILSSNINESVSAITDREQAPLALRLSGQLLLGVVRIYSRKARYLLDDCNEAILKIKMAFRPGNVDLPANQSHTATAAALNLPDVLTEVDLLGPGPDLAMLLSQDDNTSLLEPSQNLRESVERGRASSVFSNSFDPTSSRADRPIEFGRDAAKPMADDSTIFRDEDEIPDVGIQFDDIDDGLEPLKAPAPAADTTMDTTALEEYAPQPLEDDPMPTIDDEPQPDDQFVRSPTLQATSNFARAPRRSESVLSDPNPDILDSFAGREDQIFQLDDDRSAHGEERQTKRRRANVMKADVNTQLRNDTIRAQQEDRSKILKAPNFLPKDPVLLALLEMQRNGSFVSNVLGDGLSRGLAPELRGVLSLEVVRGDGARKRKRDSGVAGVESERASPEESYDAQEDAAIAGAEEAQDEPIITLPSDPAQPFEPEEDQPLDTVADPFDETTLPILHPADAGPVSLGTKHAVHLFREKLGGQDAAGSPSKRVESSVLFTDLCPEGRTLRADATKMFFETLVLATKDAVKVEQESGVLGGELRVRGKRGLWGNWAEMGTEAGAQQVTL